jgi:hypothetical protein
MIILRVAMGHGFLKKTANEFNTALVFAEQSTFRGQSQAVCVTIPNTESTTCGPGKSESTSETSIGKHTSVTGAFSC